MSSLSRRPAEGAHRYQPARNISQPGCPPGRLKKLALFRLETVGRELVAVEIADIGRISIGMPAAWTDRAFILAAGRQSRFVESCNRLTARRDKADRAAIRKARRLSISWLQHKEFR